MARFMEVLQMSCRSQNSHRLLAVYFEQYLHAGGIVAANKQVQRMIDTINDVRGPYEYFARKGRKLADMLLITE